MSTLSINTASSTSQHHPTFLKMVVNAVLNITDGSITTHSIGSYIKSNYDIDCSNGAHKTHLGKAIKLALEHGILAKKKGTGLTGSFKKVTPATLQKSVRRYNKTTGSHLTLRTTSSGVSIPSVKKTAVAKKAASAKKSVSDTKVKAEKPKKVTKAQSDKISGKAAALKKLADKKDTKQKAVAKKDDDAVAKKDDADGRETKTSRRANKMHAEIEPPRVTLKRTADQALDELHPNDTSTPKKSKKKAKITAEQDSEKDEEAVKPTKTRKGRAATIQPANTDADLSNAVLDQLRVKSTVKTDRENSNQEDKENSI